MFRYIGRLPILALVAAASAFGGPISIRVTPSIAPNIFGSPSWAGYLANAVGAIESLQAAGGNPTLPSYYAAQTGPITAFDMIVTGFPSWHGLADPGAVFGPAFANELGNRPQFGIDINGNGTPVSISELSFVGASNDPGNLLGFTFGTGSYNYSANYVGIIYGPGGPTYITSGPNTQLVDRIVGRGSGNADAAYCTGCSVAQQQAAILALLPDFEGITGFSGTYTLTDLNQTVLASGSATLEVTPVPEADAFVLILTGLILIRLRPRG